MTNESGTVPGASGRGMRSVAETDRLAALERYDILDSPAEASFDRITSLVRTVLGVPMAAVSLVDRDRQWFKSHPGIEASETPRDIAFCDYTVAGGVPMVVADAHRDPRFHDNPMVIGAPYISSYAGVPLTSRDGFHVGTLCALDAKPRDFKTIELEILTSFAAIIVDELELRQIARYDHLTGALARRAFVAEAARAIARRDRYGRPCTLVLFDLDHFKAINDRGGHAAGDLVLRAVTASCMPILRANDLLGRVGGEEFGLLLPELSPAEALAAAERFRAAIAAMAEGPVTASFGVAPLSDDITTTGSWFAAADLAQFAAKRAGRNCARMNAPGYRRHPRGVTAAAIVVLTGAGISAESGVPTFRGPDGLWEGHRIEDVATPQAFARDPVLVQRFYDARRAALRAVVPNAAHNALARLDRDWPGDLLLVTQNVDDLHDRAVAAAGLAGGGRLVHIHGELTSARCARCGDRRRVAGDLTGAAACGCGGTLRPGHRLVRRDAVPHGPDRGGAGAVRPVRLDRHERRGLPRRRLRRRRAPRRGRDARTQPRPVRRHPAVRRGAPWPGERAGAGMGRRGAGGLIRRKRRRHALHAGRPVLTVSGSGCRRRPARCHPYARAVARPPSAGGGSHPPDGPSPAIRCTTRPTGPWPIRKHETAQLR